jgi:acyl-CoA thioester hydrolase
MVRSGVSRVFQWRAPVWQADVDACGELRTSALLRLLQETATRASTDAGFDPAYYERAGTMWLVRRTALERFAPARYEDDVVVTTWIADFRRVRSRRDYELRCGDRLVARAHTDWVYCDGANRPRRIPAEMLDTFAPEGAVALERTPFPEEPPPPTAAVSKRRVELHELDALRHVNNANYVDWVEQATYDAVAAAGWPLAAQLAAGGRFRAVAHDLEYLDAALPDEVVTVTSWWHGVASDAVERRAWVARPAAIRPLLRACSGYVWTTLADETASPMPESARAALAAQR